MNCKNCQTPLNQKQSYCSECGAKIIKNRITIKSLASDFTAITLGWDNKFFFTIKMLLLKPDILLKEYLGGTRKKYMNPFTLLALGTAIALFIFNFFSEDYTNLSIEANRNTFELYAKILKKQIGESFNSKAFIEENITRLETYNTIMLKYFNLLVILFLPIYTLLSFFTYRKPYNYGEHLIINCYIQGLSFLTTSLIFTLSVFTSPSLYILAIVLLVTYYTYAYGKLYKLTKAEAILKLFKFLAILITPIIILTIIGIIIGVIYAIITS